MSAAVMNSGRSTHIDRLSSSGGARHARLTKIVDAGITTVRSAAYPMIYRTLAKTNGRMLLMAVEMVAIQAVIAVTITSFLTILCSPSVVVGASAVIPIFIATMPVFMTVIIIP
ncbi:MAG: hypothetical protein CMK06_05200 [Ponticaulis sp.]|nr:hypothetical protein [Ponticaulis sp.]